MLTDPYNIDKIKVSDDNKLILDNIISSIYNDLKNINTEKEAFEHYMNYGIQENRKLIPLEVKNIHKYKKLLDQKDIDLIEKNLSQYIYYK